MLTLSNYHFKVFVQTRGTVVELGKMTLPAEDYPDRFTHAREKFKAGRSPVLQLVDERGAPVPLKWHTPYDEEAPQ